MRKTILAAALTSTFLIGASSAIAAGKNELTFGGWSVSNGDITTGVGSVCDVNFTCSVVAEGKGFKQLQITSKSGLVPIDEEGVSYIMTIVTDQNATGNTGSLGFEDVSFVQVKITNGGTEIDNVDGIFSQQRISETAGTAVFNTANNLATGWAGNIVAIENPMTITQSLQDLGPEFSTLGAGDDFKSTFYYASSRGADGNRDGFVISIDQSAGLATLSSGAITDVQVFSFRERQGSMLTAFGSVFYDGITVSWNANEDIKAAWVGQQIGIGSGVNSSGFGTQVLSGDFGYLSFQNVAPAGGGVVSASGYGMTLSDSSAASVWDEVFVIPGPSSSVSGLDTPCIIDPSGKTCV